MESESTTKIINSKEIFDWSKEAIATQHLPLPAKPRTEDPQFDFPTEPDKLSNIQLGQLMLRMTAYHAYALRLYGMADAEYTVVDTEFKLLASREGLKIREEVGRVSADVVESLVVSSGANNEVIELFQRKTKLEAIKNQLDIRLKIYEKCWQALSRELARRELETKMA